MLWNAGLALVSKIMYAISVFASTIIGENLNLGFEPWNLLLMTLMFFIVQSQVAVAVDVIFADVSETQSGARLKHIFKLWLDTNVDTLMYVLVQWTVDMLQRQWTLTSDPVAAFISVDMPVLLGITFVKAYRNTRFENVGVLEIADSTLSSMMFSIAFFLSSTLVDKLRLNVSLWTWLLFLLTFAVFTTAVAWCFSQWKPYGTSDATEIAKMHDEASRKALTVDEDLALKEAYGQEQAKDVILQNWKALNYVMAFMLANMYSSIIASGWAEMQSPLLGGVVLFSIFLITVAGVTELTENDHLAMYVPSGVIDRVLFAMALFLSNRIDTSSFAISALMVAVGLILIAVIHYVLGELFEEWIVDLTSDDGKRYAVLKKTLKNVSTTMVSIAMAILVKRVVDVFQELWIMDQNRRIAAVFVGEAIILLMIGTVHFLEPILNTKNDAADTQPPETKKAS